MRLATEAPAGALGVDAALPLAALDRLLARARDVAAFPAAWISLFEDGAERLVARSGIGFDALGPGRSVALGAASLRAPLVVEDLRAAGYASHWLACEGGQARFLAIMPLASSAGAIVGTLTVMDREPRKLDALARSALENLAALAIARIEARRDVAEGTPAQPQEAALARERQFAEALLESVEGAVALIGDDGKPARWNAAFARAAGRSHADIARMNVLDLFAPARREEAAAAMREAAAQGREAALECELVDAAGERRLHLVSAARVRLGAATALLVIARDVASQRRAEYLATRDPLTGLPNRLLLDDRLEQAVINAARQRGGFAFMFIDLDRFKTVNDSLGHQVGDALLREVAARLARCVRASDTVARIGGDEFAIILENLRPDDEGPRQVAEKIVASLALPIDALGHSLVTSCSVGIAVYPADARGAAEITKAADVAMYHAKEQGRNNYQFFAAGMNVRAQERLALESYLRLAVKRQELALHYQPRVRMADGQLVAVEALLRWRHPRRGLLGPEAFLEIAAESGLIVPIGEWAMREACRQLAAWRRTLEPRLRVSLNVCEAQLAQGERLHAALDAAMRDAALDADAVEIEIREADVIDALDERAAAVQRLKALGIGVVLDDFGSGHASLACVHALPLQAIKIDARRSRAAAGERAARAAVAMAHALGLAVIAAGVEDAQEVERLRALGCDTCQGFVESEALPAAGIEARYGARG
jgi:diguanylate cyclase (GGDEF)-like protein/PAS domain S-box-containing protein